MAVCPHKGLDLPTTHLELIISKMVYWCRQDIFRIFRDGFFIWMGLAFQYSCHRIRSLCGETMIFFFYIFVVAMLVTGLQ